jgi:D-amino-acid dehydrogenase
MPTKDILVLGAGMVGVCTAIALRQRGHNVCLVDQRAPGQETSYGNAGIIQREAVWPYAMPRDWRVLLGGLLGTRLDVRVRLADLPRLLSPLWRYWQAGHPRHYPAICQAHASLIAHCLSEHQALMDSAGAGDLVRQTGYLSVYRTAAALDRAVHTAGQMDRGFGVPHQVLAGAALQAAEPLLHTGAGGAVGGIHWTQPWCCVDPGELVSRYAQLFTRLGGHVARADAMTLASTATGWQVSGSDGGGGLISARAAVVSLGPWSGPLTQRLGYRFPLFVKRGYHQHFASPQALVRPVLDAEVGYVLAPTAYGTRLTTGAELAALSAPSSLAQLRGAARAAEELYHLGEPLAEPPWRGSRPCTGDMLPVVGAAPRHPGLWFNFGHGHQGFTLGPVTARLLAELMEGTPPMVDPRPFAAERFG